MATLRDPNHSNTIGGGPVGNSLGGAIADSLNIFKVLPITDVKSFFDPNHVGQGAPPSVVRDLISKGTEAIRGGINAKGRLITKGFILDPKQALAETQKQIKPRVLRGSQRTKRANELYIVDLITGEKIGMQFVPRELDYKPESSFVAIESMGRNNPLYHYTGSEDTLSFELDWHIESNMFDDVLGKCKKLEALSKNNGFDEPPHPVLLVWGGLMFSDAKWLMVAAPYKLSGFYNKIGLFTSRGETTGTVTEATAGQQQLDPKFNPEDAFFPAGMLPSQAYQSITLKRITDNNRTRNQIRSPLT